MIDDIVVFNMVEETKGGFLAKIIGVNLKTGEEIKIAEEFFITDEENPQIYTGTILFSCGGWSEGVYYNRVTYDHTLISSDAPVDGEIRYYDFQERKSTKVMDYPHETLYLSGDKTAIVISDYNVFSKSVSGKLFMKSGTEYKEIKLETVVGGEDIRGSSRLDDGRILIYNHKDYYLYEPKKGELSMENYNKATVPDEFLYYGAVYTNGRDYGYTKQTEKEIEIIMKR